jgi:hypothetical protein
MRQRSKNGGDVVVNGLAPRDKIDLPGDSGKV